MIKEIIINLLNNKTCKNCIYKDLYSCSCNQDFKKKYNTCKSWTDEEEVFNSIKKVVISQSAINAAYPAGKTAAQPLLSKPSVKGISIDIT